MNSKYLPKYWKIRFFKVDKLDHLRTSDSFGVYLHYPTRFGQVSWDVSDPFNQIPTKKCLVLTKLKFKNMLSVDQSFFFHLL